MTKSFNTRRIVQQEVQFCVIFVDFLKARYFYHKVDKQGLLNNSFGKGRRSGVRSSRGVFLLNAAQTYRAASTKLCAILNGHLLIQSCAFHVAEQNARIGGMGNYKSVIPISSKL